MQMQKMQQLECVKHASKKPNKRIKRKVPDIIINDQSSVTNEN
ncbi:hypothetical protein bpuCAU1_001836 (plasmid) [Borrelia puertoricensis]